MGACRQSPLVCVSFPLYVRCSVHASSKTKLSELRMCQTCLWRRGVTTTSWLCLFANLQLEIPYLGHCFEQTASDLNQGAGIGSRPGAHDGGSLGRLIRRRAHAFHHPYCASTLRTTLAYLVVFPRSDFFFKSLCRSRSPGIEASV
jgi:hypothetical protein